MKIPPHDTSVLLCTYEQDKADIDILFHLLYKPFHLSFMKWNETLNFKLIYLNIFSINGN